MSRLSQSATCRRKRRAQYWQQWHTNVHMQAHTKCQPLPLNDWLGHSNMVRSQRTVSISSFYLTCFISQPRTSNKDSQQTALVFAAGCSGVFAKKMLFHVQRGMFFFKAKTFNHVCLMWRLPVETVFTLARLSVCVCHTANLKLSWFLHWHLKHFPLWLFMSLWCFWPISWSWTYSRYISTGLYVDKSVKSSQQNRQKYV